MMKHKKNFFKNLSRQVLLLTVLFFGTSLYAQSTTVAVAANMNDAFAEINMAFKADTKNDLKVIYGSSGNFTAQIMNGASFNLFLSADDQFPLELYKNGKTVDEGRIYAIGKIVLYTKNTSGIKLSDQRDALVVMIQKANKIAIAKPELAPYGRAAVEYLKAMGVWDLAKDKLVYGDNISGATVLVTTGAADLGITALSLAKSPNVAKDTNYLIVSDKLYEPIKQRMVLLKNPPADAVYLYQYLQNPKAKAILVKYGYALPKY